MFNLLLTLAILTIGSQRVTHLATIALEICRKEKDATLADFVASWISYPIYRHCGFCSPSGTEARLVYKWYQFNKVTEGKSLSPKDGAKIRLSRMVGYLESELKININPEDVKPILMCDIINRRSRYIFHLHESNKKTIPGNKFSILNCDDISRCIGGVSIQRSGTTLFLSDKVLASCAAYAVDSTIAVSTGPEYVCVGIDNDPVHRISMYRKKDSVCVYEGEFRSYDEDLFSGVRSIQLSMFQSEKELSVLLLTQYDLLCYRIPFDKPHRIVLFSLASCH
ncbi:MAG: hypothetical protein ACRCZF_00575 [Gemmataceae bacterium]